MTDRDQARHKLEIECPRCHQDLEFRGRDGERFCCEECGLEFKIEDGEALYDPDEARDFPPLEYLRRRIRRNRETPTRIQQALLTVTRRASRLGLVAPFIMDTWDSWYAETNLGKEPAVVTMSDHLETRRGRERIAAGYGESPLRCTPERLLAHEVGHVFQEWWSNRRGVAPIKGFRKVFDGPERFSDPWNDLQEYLETHPDFTYDADRYISDYAWSDPGEDFAEVFAEVVAREGRIEAFRHRPGIYRKMRFLLKAGRQILCSDPVLRLCNREDLRYLCGGEERFDCSADGYSYGVPLVEGEYVCPCGGIVVYDGEDIYHCAEQA